MGDEARRADHFATRLLPWITAGLGACVTVPCFAAAAGLGVWVGFWYLVLLGAAMVARAALRPREEPLPLTSVTALWGAVLGPLCLSGLVGLIAWTTGDGWILLGIVGLLLGLPLAMLLTGATAWAVAKLFLRRRARPEERTAARLWVPITILVLVLGVPTFFVVNGWSIELRRLAALSPGTRPEMLARLASDEAVAQQVAGNPATPASALRKLAANPRPRVREAVAWNGNTPLEVLDALTRDESPDVRRSAESTLQRLHPISSPPPPPVPAAEPR